MHQSVDLRVLLLDRDGSSTVVEIEAATKRLFTKRRQVGVAVLDAKTKDAEVQISRYKHYVDGIGRRATCEKLGKPDNWRFNYLLVAGSTMQADFDEKSWRYFQQQYLERGIALKAWDFYIDRLMDLERWARASHA